MVAAWAALCYLVPDAQRVNSGEVDKMGNADAK